MKIKSLLVIVAIFATCILHTNAQSTYTNPIVDESIIFEEKLGIVAVEAEFFYRQSKTDKREWYRSSKNEKPNAGRDEDTLHVYGASNNAYLEILPDTRVTHADPLVNGENFNNIPDSMPTVHYKVKFTNPGRYYVWARAYSTGGEDNGVHVGLNYKWPESGQRIQWCDGKNEWTWSSKQRTDEVHCGIPYAIYLDILKPGIHDIQFSMREDGFEFDKFILTKDRYYKPEGTGPKVVANAALPDAYPAVPAPKIEKTYFEKLAQSIPKTKWIAAQQFPSLGTNYYEHGKNWMAINPEEYKEAITSTSFDYESGKYDLVFVAVGENDGSSTFRISINGKELGEYSPKISENMFEMGKNSNALWKGVSMTKGDKITVWAKVGTDGQEFTRGRWAGIIFTPVGKGQKIQNTSLSYVQNK
ncbi:hypothetical protein [Reichenbachiella ulvae]|uniref:Gylcosyl hydrolase 115 C-terminal domain-containing protein n=1 Tax=Reichenbachiella ulvae TaxID=2980104 RepID=A0ABT3CTV8_9BACT|nr:hypothetical protein [Reichenbachiella ulvae]MCV9386668.1 hypothetical protein [Reichenbachiella ulvae]